MSISFVRGSQIACALAVLAIAGALFAISGPKSDFIIEIVCCGLFWFVGVALILGLTINSFRRKHSSEQKTSAP